MREEEPQGDTRVREQIGTDGDQPHGVDVRGKRRGEFWSPGLVLELGGVGAEIAADPFGQLKRAVAANLAATGLDPATPVHMGIVLPHMLQTAFPWEPSPHILTRELLAPEPPRRSLAVTSKP